MIHQGLYYGIQVSLICVICVPVYALGCPAIPPSPIIKIS